MHIILLVAFPVLGTIVGSFLGVITNRLNTGMTIHGRSKCLSCGKTLQWFELIPVFSFIAQRGRCRSCGAKIPRSVFIIELVTAIAFFGIGYRYMSAALIEPLVWITIAVYLILVSMLIIISLYDIEHTIVPDKVVIPFIVFTFVIMFFLTPRESFILSAFALPHWSHALSGIIIPLPFFLIWLFSKGRLMGFGDIKLMIGMGWLLGLPFGISAVIFAFWIGALISIGMIIAQRVYRLVLRRKHFIMSTEIPFAPFLAIGVYLVIVLRWNLFVMPFL